MLTLPEELPEERGDGAVHQDSGGGDGHHDARLDGDRSDDAMDGGEGDPCGENDQRERVDEGGEDAGALVAEGLLVGGGAALEVDGDKGEPDGEHVREVVAGLGDEGEGVGAQAKVERRHNVAEGGGERDEEDALHPARVGRDLVHGSSIRGSILAGDILGVAHEIDF